MSNVDNEFITGFEHYLKPVRNCSHNTAIKYIANFKKIIRIAHKNKWIKHDPFVHWEGKLKHVEREFLTQNEIIKLLNTQFKIKRLEYVRDSFIFSCYTGLAYADIKKLTENDLEVVSDGDLWIKTSRTKTKSKCHIPLLPTAHEILNKYKGFKDEHGNLKLLPVLSNQKMNAYLKEIADLSGIKKNLTTHLARHTFAATVTLNNGVPIEYVSKMLGHKNLKTTQHYAKLLDKKVSDDMKMLKTKLSFQNN